MHITRNQLRRLIKEELGLLREAPLDIQGIPGGYVKKGSDPSPQGDWSTTVYYLYGDDSIRFIHPNLGKVVAVTEEGDPRPWVAIMRNVFPQRLERLSGMLGSDVFEQELMAMNYEEIEPDSADRSGRREALDLQFADEIAAAEEAAARGAPHGEESHEDMKARVEEEWGDRESPWPDEEGAAMTRDPYGQYSTR